MSLAANDDLIWLASWFGIRANHDGPRITLQTLDNPGWILSVELPTLETKDEVIFSEGAVPSAANGNIGGNDWLECRIRSGRLVVAGDPTKLPKLFRAARDYLEHLA